MKKLLAIALLVLLASLAFGQAKTTPTTQTPAQAQAPTGSHLPQAKTPEEFKAYQDALAKHDAPGAEAAANDFATEYPNSELRAALYQQAMTMYDGVGNSPKALEMARKTLQLEPENVVALVVAASNLAEHTRESDLDKDDRLNEAATDANKALGLVDDMIVPSTLTPEQAKTVRGTLRSWAWTSLGIGQYIRKDYAAAEASFLKAVDFGKANPEALLFLRLTLAQDQLGKYSQALQNIDTVLKLAPAGSQLAQLAGNEKDRLTKLSNAPPK